jgi:hypothetical protein
MPPISEEASGNRSFSPRQVLKGDDQEPGTPIRPACERRSRACPDKASQAVGGSKRERSYPEGGWVSYESIVSMKLGHRI